MCYSLILGSYSIVFSSLLFTLWHWLTHPLALSLYRTLTIITRIPHIASRSYHISSYIWNHTYVYVSVYVYLYISKCTFHLKLIINFNRYTISFALSEAFVISVQWQRGLVIDARYTQVHSPLSVENNYDKNIRTFCKCNDHEYLSCSFYRVIDTRNGKENVRSNQSLWKILEKVVKSKNLGQFDLFQVLVDHG